MDNKLIDTIDKLREEIFDLHEVQTHLRGQITYLQEELASVEDERDKEVATLNAKIEQLEAYIGETK